MQRHMMLLLAASVACECFAAAGMSSRRFHDNVKKLASAEMKGRYTGSPEGEKAADWIAEQFRRAGLQPLFTGSDGKPSWFSAFPVTTSAKLGTRNHFRHGGEELKFGRDFTTLNFSSNGNVEAPLVFAGYGITAPEYGYDDYAGVEAKGRIVVVLRHEPQEFDESSVFAGRQFTRHAMLDAKAINAKMHGAVALVLVNNSINHPEDSERLESFGRLAGPREIGIPCLQVKSGVLDEWLQKSGRNLRALVEGIDKERKADSFALAADLKVQLETDIERVVKNVRNVGGMLPGSSNEHIVIGAHYDHIGLGEQFSMAPSEAGRVHPGADDNASGVSGLIELAWQQAANPSRRRALHFVAFTAEEIGLLGSAQHAASLQQSSPAAAMVNFDMIGRMRDNQFYLGGLSSGKGMKDLADRLAAEQKLKVESTDSIGVGGSDHVSFVARQVPSVFVFSGLHGDYHKPSDTADKINKEGALRILEWASAFVSQLSEQPERPEFVRVAPPPSPGGGGNSGGGYGPYFGSVPDFAEVKDGVRFSDVRPGSPAEKAGLQGGDILTEFDGKKISNLYDYTYALRGRKPGDTVQVKIRRGDASLEFSVLLEARK
jgi:hypothetical protein